MLQRRVPAVGNTDGFHLLYVKYKVGIGLWKKQELRNESGAQGGSQALRKPDFG